MCQPQWLCAELIESWIRMVPTSQWRSSLVGGNMLVKSGDHTGKKRNQVLLQIRNDLKLPSKAYRPSPSWRSGGHREIEGGEAAEVQELAGRLWKAGLVSERPERRAETLLGLLGEPPPLSRLSPPPPVPPLPKPRKAGQVSSSAFAFPSRCPLQAPRAALTPSSGHGHTEGPP